MGRTEGNFFFLKGMKLLTCLLAATSWADVEPDHHPAYEKHPIKDVVKRLDKLQSVGEECRGKLIDVNAAKQNKRMQVYHKLFTMDRVARKFYNKMNGDYYYYYRSVPTLATYTHFSDIYPL